MRAPEDRGHGSVGLARPWATTARAQARNEGAARRRTHLRQICLSQFVLRASSARVGSMAIVKATFDVHHTKRPGPPPHRAKHAKQNKTRAWPGRFQRFTSRSYMHRI